MDEITHALDNLACVTVQKTDNIEKLTTTLKQALKEVHSLMPIVEH